MNQLLMSQVTTIHAFSEAFLADQVEDIWKKQQEALC